MKEVTVSELKSMMDRGEDFQLIDVRETYENEIASIGGINIPMGTINDSIDDISRDGKVVLHCKSGSRSAAVQKMLEEKHGFSNIYNLRGGIMAWADQIDSTVSKY